MKPILWLVLAVATASACERNDDNGAAAKPAASAPAQREAENGMGAAPSPALPSAAVATSDSAVMGASASADGGAAAVALGASADGGAAAAADNTGKNERDRSGETLTPGDQKENEVDLTITQNIRKGVIDRDGLSMAARNVKIITADGVVTLRGPVESAKEKATIASIAKGVDGAKRVDNQLEVAAK